MPIDQETIVELLIDGLMLGSVELDFEKVREEIKKHRQKQSDANDDDEPIDTDEDWGEVIEQFKKWTKLKNMQNQKKNLKNMMKRLQKCMICL